MAVYIVSDADIVVGQPLEDVGTSQRGQEKEALRGFSYTFQVCLFSFYTISRPVRNKCELK